MIAYYMDENMHSAITNGVRSKGVDVLTVQEDGFSGIADPQIFQRAVALKRVLVSFDRDMINVAMQYQARFDHFEGLIFINLHKSSFGAFITELELISLTSHPAECSNQIQYLPLQ